MDAIRFARLAENAGTSVAQDFESPSAALDAVLLLEECMQDHGKKLPEVMLCLTSRMKTLLRKSQPWRIGQGQAPNGNFETFDDMKLQVVSGERFYTAVDLLDGVSGGYQPAAGGYALTTDTDVVSGKTYYTKSGNAYTKVTTPAKADIATYYELTGKGAPINFMGLTKDAAEAIQRHKTLRYFPPEVYQKSNSHCWQFRVFHDLIVLDNKKPLTYCSHATA